MPGWPPDPLFGDIPDQVTTQACWNGIAMKSIALNPYSNFVAYLEAKDFSLLATAVAERKCREAIGAGTFQEAADLFRPDPLCPTCGTKAFRNGKNSAGKKRYICPSCNKRFSALTGTILEYSKKDLATWKDFITLMCHNASIDLAAEMCDIAHNTAFEWRHRVFATVDGYQDRLVLKDRIWLDETYVSDSSLLRGPDFRPKRGISKQKICITLAIDIHKNAIAKVFGHGRPSVREQKEALLGHIKEGSVIVCDKEKAHSPLIKAAKCEAEFYKADPKDPVYLEAMQMINNYNSWIKRFLLRYPGMKKANLQSYLNWFAYLFRVKRDEDKWPKTERVIRHLLITDARFRS